MSWREVRSRLVARYAVARDRDDELVIAIGTQHVQATTIAAHGRAWLVLRADVAHEDRLRADEVMRTNGRVIPGALVLDHGIYFLQYGIALDDVGDLDALLATFVAEAVRIRAAPRDERANIALFSIYSE